MKKFFILLFIVLSTSLHAQVYYYKFIKSKGNGVYFKDRKGNSYNRQSDIYIVFISGNYMDCTKCSNTTFQKELANDENYWSNWVRTQYNNFATSYNNPPKSTDYAFTCRYPPENLDLLDLVSIVSSYKYNASLSDSNLSTYTYGYANAQTDGRYALLGAKYWSEWHIGQLNYSFSSNKDRMIIWDTEKPNDVLIYEMIDLNDYKFDMNNLKKHLMD